MRGSRPLSLVAAMLLAMAVPTDKSMGGAWAQPQGKGLAVLAYYFYATDSQFGTGWNVEPFEYEGRFLKNEWNLYLEYGITDRLTLVGNFFLDALQFENQFESNSNFGLADQEIAMRYQFAEKIPQSLQVTVKIPGPYYVSNQPSLGNGQVDIEWTYYAGTTFQVGSRWAFVDAGLGFRLRTGPPADELRWYLTAGYNLTNWLDIYFVEASGIFGLGNNTPQMVGENILLTTDFDLIKIGCSLLVHPAKGWGIQAGPYWNIAGRATGASGGFKVAVWREF